VGAEHDVEPGMLIALYLKGHNDVRLSDISTLARAAASIDLI
jgi:hypothetical protein